MSILQKIHVMYVKRNNEVCLCNDCCNVKAICITYSECLSVALVIHHAMRKRHVVFCGLSGSTVFFFPTLSHKRRDFGGGGDFLA